MTSQHELLMLGSKIPRVKLDEIGLSLHQNYLLIRQFALSERIETYQAAWEIHQYPRPSHGWVYGVPRKIVYVKDSPQEWSPYERNTSQTQISPKRHVPNCSVSIRVRIDSLFPFEVIRKEVHTDIKLFPPWEISEYS